jgi:hypothetical protein
VDLVGGEGVGEAGRDWHAAECLGILRHPEGAGEVAREEPLLGDALELLGRPLPPASGTGRHGIGSVDRRMLQLATIDGPRVSNIFMMAVYFIRTRFIQEHGYDPEVE